MASTDGERLAERCNTLVKEARPDEAVALARSEIGSVDPELAAHAHNWLAWHFLSRGAAIVPALEHATHAVRLIPEWGTALLNLARIEELLGKKDDAYAHYRAAMLRSPYDYELARKHAIAIFLEHVAHATSAAIVSVPADPKFPIWVVVAPSGAHLLVVHQAAYGFLVNTPMGEPLPDDPAAAAHAVAASAASETVSLTEAIVEMQRLIAERFSHPTLVNIPGSGNTFSEVHAQSEAVYVQFSRTGPMETRPNLAKLLEAKLRNVESQLAAFANRDRVWESLHAFTHALLAILNARVPTPDGKPWFTNAPARRTFLTCSVAWGNPGEHEIAHVCVEDDVPVLRIVGHRNATPLDSLTPDRAADLLAHRITQLTVDRLVPGAQYRLIERFVREPGELVTFDERIDYDNHWIAYKFTAADGTSFETSDAETERYLALP
jgi:tetratricopeptide (TPR) repeat protein